MTNWPLGFKAVIPVRLTQIMRRSVRVQISWLARQMAIPNRSYPNRAASYITLCIRPSPRPVEKYPPLWSATRPSHDCLDGIPNWHFCAPAGPATTAGAGWRSWPTDPPPGCLPSWSATSSRAPGSSPAPGEATTGGRTWAMPMSGATSARVSACPVRRGWVRAG